MSVSAQTRYDRSSTARLEGQSGEADVVRRILLVEEQAHVLRVIRLNLERCGYLVDAVLSAELALQQVRTHRYDAVIMTSDLPDMTSGQLCEQMQALLDSRSQDSQWPLILVGRDESVEWTGGGDNCEPLDRPVSLKLILTRLGKHFETSASIGAECH